MRIYAQIIYRICVILYITCHITLTKITVKRSLLLERFYNFVEPIFEINFVEIPVYLKFYRCIVTGWDGNEISSAVLFFLERVTPSANS